MTPFVSLEGVAAPLPLDNIDTDKILPGRFLKTISREGLGVALFDTLRRDEAGRERPDFILNQPFWRNASILIALDNFGCGSSREHAPWALLDFGIRCVIATSFADIFYNNCFKNGILPVVLPQGDVLALLELAGNAERALINIDLPAQTVLAADGVVRTFNIDAKRKSGLLQGLDEISATLARDDAIATFERRRAQNQPWFPGISGML